MWHIGGGGGGGIGEEDVSPPVIVVVVVHKTSSPSSLPSSSLLLLLLLLLLLNDAAVSDTDVDDWVAAMEGVHGRHSHWYDNIPSPARRHMFPLLHVAVEGGWWGLVFACYSSTPGSRNCAC